MRAWWKCVPIYIYIYMPMLSREMPTLCACLQYRSCAWWPSLLRLAPPFLAAMANTYFVAERKQNGCIKRSFIQRVVEGGHCRTISRSGQCHCYCGSECASDKGQATAIAVNPDNPNHEGGPYTKRAITWLRSFRNRISRGVGDLSLVGL